MRFFRFLTMLIFLGIVLGCSQNAFIESAKRDTDSALLFEARKKMNGSNWADAITLIGQMSTTGQANRGTKITLASAYAGKCGLNLIQLADHISTSSDNIFVTLLSALNGATAASVADCVSGETAIQSISTSPASRTDDENVLMAFISFAKIGAVLATYADTNSDLTPDPGFDSCNTAHLPDAMLREVGTGITLAVAALAQTGGSFGGALSSSVTSACTTLAGINPNYDFCSVTTASAFTSDQAKAIATIIKSSDNPGLSTCAGSVAACACP